MSSYTRNYKVDIGDIFMVFRNDRGSFTSYSIPIKSGGKYYYKEVRFNKGVEIQNREKIKIKDFFEIVRDNKRDKYNAIWGIFITDFERVEKEGYDPFDDAAIKEYKQEVSDDMYPF